MGQIRHACPRTTHKLNAPIQKSQVSTAALHRKPGVNPKTVAEWRKIRSKEPHQSGHNRQGYHYDSHGQLCSNLPGLPEAYGFARRSKI